MLILENIDKTTPKSEGSLRSLEIDCQVTSVGYNINSVFREDATNARYLGLTSYDRRTRDVLVEETYPLGSTKTETETYWNAQELSLFRIKEIRMPRLLIQAQVVGLPSDQQKFQSVQDLVFGFQSDFRHWRTQLVRITQGGSSKEYKSKPLKSKILGAGIIGDLNLQQSGFENGLRTAELMISLIDLRMLKSFRDRVVWERGTARKPDSEADGQGENASDN